MATSAPDSSSPQIIYRQLGKCGLRVSVPILGGMNFGHTGWGFGDWVLGEEESMTILKAAWDRGINTIDTANTYSNGISEEIIGKFLKKYNIPRHKFTIITKIINPVSEKPGEWVVDTFPGKTDPNYVNQEGLSRAAIFNATEACLRRLDTSYIDLLMIHRFDFETPIEETMKALHDLVTSGKVRYIGASNMKTYQFMMMNECARRNGWTQFANMQCEYSLLYREEEREMIPYCRENGIGITAWSPLAMGYLARPANVDPQSARSEANRLSPYQYLKLPGSEEIVNRLEEVAKKKQESMASVALAWALKEASSVVVGIAKVPRLDDAMVGRKALTDEERKFLEEPYQPQKPRY